MGKLQLPQIGPLMLRLTVPLPPIKPTELVFRDGALIRPVCPFFEFWAMVGEPGSQPSTWQASGLEK